MSEYLSNLIERWCGVQPGPGEGTAWSLGYAWYWPPWLTLLLAVGAVLFVVGIYLREGGGASRRYRLTLACFRLSLLLLVVLMIAQVSLKLQRTGLPTVAVVIDDSQSMAVTDRYDEKTAKSFEHRVKEAVRDGSELQRWRLAQTLLLERDADLLNKLENSYRLRAFYLTGVRSANDSGLKELTEEIRRKKPLGDSTRLGAGVRDVLDHLRGSVPAAILLLTDGVNTDGPSLSEGAASAQRRGVPLFCVGVGSEQPVRDLKLSNLLVEDVVFVDDVVPFECKVTSTGFLGTKLNVVLREKDKSEPLAKVEITAGPDEQPQPVRLIYRPTQVGRFEFVVEIEPQSGELQKENNRLSHVVEVRKEKIRVLLAQAYPNYEYRYLRNMLERDETIELHTVLQEADLAHAEQDKAALRVFPERREDLFSYEVILFGDVNPSLLSDAVLQSLAEFVDQPGHGGAIVFMAGPQFMPTAYRNSPLTKLMPFEMDSVRLPDPKQLLAEGYPVQPTDLGMAISPMQLGESLEESRSIWKNLPPLYWQVELLELKPGASVLAENPNRTGSDGRKLPVILLQYVGAGKVLFHATDETWRWRYRTGDRYFARYWIQMIRFLSRSKLAESGRMAVLSTDRSEYPQGESVRLSVRFADERLAPVEDDGVTVVVEPTGQPMQRIGLRRTTGRGSFEGILSRPPAGSYHAWMAVPHGEGTAPAVDFTIAPPAGEFARIRKDVAALREAAEMTGGKYYSFENAGRLLADLPPGHQVPIETLPPIPLWNRWPVLFLFFTLIILEWVLRKRRGMV